MRFLPLLILLAGCAGNGVSDAVPVATSRRAQVQLDAAAILQGMMRARDADRVEAGLWRTPRPDRR